MIDPVQRSVTIDCRREPPGWVWVNETDQNFLATAARNMKTSIKPSFTSTDSPFDFPLTSLSPKNKLLDNDLHAIDGLHGNWNANPAMGLLPSKQDLNKLQNEEAQNMTDNNTLFITELQQKAEMGDAQAQLELADRLVEGKDVEQNVELGMQWLNSAGELGNVIAQKFLIMNYSNNTILDRCIHKFIDKEMWFAKIFDVIVQYIRNNKVLDLREKNIDLLMYWLNKAAVNNVTEAQFALGLVYDDKGCSVYDGKLACEWFDKVVEQGYVEAQYHLAILYLEGNGVQQNYELALKWLTRYIEEYDDSMSFSCDDWIDWLNACFLIADLYAEGKEVEQNDDLAILWHEKAAQKCRDTIASHRESKNSHRYYNDITEWQEWQSKLNALLIKSYERKAKVSNELNNQAYLWREKLAGFEHSESQLWLAKHYLNGDIIEYLQERISQNDCYGEAYNFAERACNNGCIEANLMFGFLCYYDIEIYEMQDEALDYFEAAVGHTDPGIAEYFLAKIYAKSGDEKGQEKVRQYLEIADVDKVWS